MSDFHGVHPITQQLCVQLSKPMSTRVDMFNEGVSMLTAHLRELHLVKEQCVCCRRVIVKPSEDWQWAVETIVETLLDKKFRDFVSAAADAAARCEYGFGRPWSEYKWDSVIRRFCDVATRLLRRQKFSKTRIADLRRVMWCVCHAMGKPKCPFYLIE